MDIKFVQAKHFYPNGNKPKLIVIHDEEYPEKSAAAEWTADFFAGRNGLTAPQASAHYCLVPETRVLFGDLSWRPIAQVAVGTVLVATEEDAPGRGGRTVQTTRVTQVRRRRALCVRLVFSDGREVTCSRDHRWLTKYPQGEVPWAWRDASDYRPGYRFMAPLRPWESRTDREAGYMEGIFDGEGCWTASGDLSFSQKRGGVLDRAKEALALTGIPFREHHRSDSGVTVVSLSGLQATLQALGQFRPRRLDQEARWVGRALNSRSHSTSVELVSIEDVGEQEVVSIETERHTFFAEGIVSHNCVDSDSVVQCVKDEDGAWHTPGSLMGNEINRISIGIEHAGYASQTEAQWLDDYSMAMLELSAELVAGLCVKHGILPVFRDEAALRAGLIDGITGHWQCTKATGVGSHTDPGPNFPWSWYLDRVVTHVQILGGCVPNVETPVPISADDGSWVDVSYDGRIYRVCPTYVPYVGIGQAEDLAKSLGCVLPTPGLVDAIWQQADLKLDGRLLAEQSDGTMATMASAAMFARHTAKLQMMIAGRSLGTDFHLLGGAFKDVVHDASGKLGIYGWHDLNGKPMQPFFGGHARGWIDYSQGLRLVRE